jgi:hypothetical protein
VVPTVRPRFSLEGNAELLRMRGVLSAGIGESLSVDDTVREMAAIISSLPPHVLRSALDQRRRERGGSGRVFVPGSGK